MPEQADKIQQEILADAERKADRTLKRAKREADKLRSAANKENEELRKRRLEEANREAEEKERAVMARLPHEERRIRLLKQEEVFQEVFDEALRQLEAGEAEIDADASIAALLDEALEAMPDAPLVATVNPKHENALRQAVEHGARQRQIELATSHAAGTGVRVATTDGRIQYDNTIRARFEREKQNLRSELATILTEA